MTKTKKSYITFGSLELSGHTLSPDAAQPRSMPPTTVDPTPVRHETSFENVHLSKDMSTLKDVP